MNSPFEYKVVAGDKLQFLTSKGTVVGVMVENPRISGELTITYPEGLIPVDFDDKNSAILSQLYKHSGGFYCADTGWVCIEIDDGFCGSPEYPAKLINQLEGMPIEMAKEGRDE